MKKINPLSLLMLVLAVYPLKIEAKEGIPMKGTLNSTTTKKKSSPNTDVYVEVKNADTLIICDYNKIDSKVVDVPLSSFIESYETIKLESSDLAYVKAGNTIISENYIGVRNYGKLPFKLFDHSGKYLRDIGSIGRGPNEYRSLYDEKIDEKRNCIYLMPWTSKKILRYDLKGNYLEPIPLQFSTVKSHFFINKDTVTVLNLPFSEKAKLAYSQTTSGEPLDVLPAGRYAITPPDFSNEIISSNNTGEYDFHLFRFFKRKNDTLYHFKSGKIQPIFTVNFNPEKVPLHIYYELPAHYAFRVMSEKKINPNTTTTVPAGFFLVDKKTYKAQRIRLVNDYLGGIEMDFIFHDGYFINNIPAITLKEKIEKVLENNKDLSKKERQRLIKFNDSFKEEDNNIVFFGKLKGIN